jgi:hypothetical protein
MLWFTAAGIFVGENGLLIIFAGVEAIWLK